MAAAEREEKVESDGNVPLKCGREAMQRVQPLLVSSDCQLVLYKGVSKDGPVNEFGALLR